MCLRCLNFLLFDLPFACCRVRSSVFFSFSTDSNDLLSALLTPFITIFLSSFSLLVWQHYSTHPRFAFCAIHFTTPLFSSDIKQVQKSARLKQLLQAVLLLGNRANGQHGRARKSSKEGEDEDDDDEDDEEVSYCLYKDCSLLRVCMLFLSIRCTVLPVLM